MKMLPTSGAVPVDQYTAYVHNCLRNPACEPAYAAPLPGVPYLQLYADFGQYKPTMFEIEMQDTCDTGHVEQLFPSNYIIGQTSEGNWYGVFKYFTSPVDPVKQFVVWLSVFVDTPGGPVEKTYFSETFGVNDCDLLMKVKACQPEGATTTGFDVNGLYYGLPVNNDTLGLDGIRYFHIAYVRQGKVKEISNKATFKSSLIRNFRTTVEKNWRLETELVPQWYKDILLAIYARGAVQINDLKTWLVDELAIESINDDDLQWKPFAQLKETFRLYYGCDESECVECCSPIVIEVTAFSEGESSVVPPCIPVSIPEGQILPDAPIDVPFFFAIDLDGDAPFSISNVVAPAWMTVALVGSQVQLSGTPLIGDVSEGVEVSFRAHNCEDLDASASESEAFTGALYEDTMTVDEMGAAYSLRKIRPTATKAIRVRRDDDNAEMDIGFLGVDLDTTTLLDFCGIANGFVSKWYDQSGCGNDAAQVFFANQPRIVNAGITEMSNGKPAIWFDPTVTSRFLVTPAFRFVSTGGLWTYSLVAEPFDLNLRLLWNCDNNTAGVARVAQLCRTNGAYNALSLFLNPGVAAVSDAPAGSVAGVQAVVSGIRRAVPNVECYLNGATNGPSAIPGTSTPQVLTTEATIGAFNRGTNFPYKGFLQEIVHYRKEDDVLRAAWETDQAAYY